MKVFITGGSGFIGSEVVRQLVASNFEIIALARTEKSANKIKTSSADIEIVKGDLTSIDVITDAVKRADAIVHCAFDHDFTQFLKSVQADAVFVEKITLVLAGSNKPFAICSGVFGIKPDSDGVIRETSKPVTVDGFGSRHGTAENLLASASSNLKPIVIRLPPSVHGEGDYGFVPHLLELAKEKGQSVYVDDASWSAVNVKDVALLIVKVITNPPKSGEVIHGIAESAIPTKLIAEAISKKANVPLKKLSADELAQYGLIALLFGRNATGSSDATQEKYNWKPTAPSLLDDISKYY